MSRLWLWLPVVVRAPLVGLAVQLAGVFSFVYLIQANLATTPDLPWAAPVELGVLWLLWRYLRGDGWPRSTSEARQRRLRAVVPDRRLWLPAACAGLAVGLSIACQVVFGYSLVEMPEGGGLLALTSAPPLTALLLLMSGAVMTGFTEEAAFRGYMQQPIEERHGPAVAIVLVATLFALAHTPPLVLLPLFVFGACGWGLLARLTRSTLPGMVVHGLVDAGFFLWILWRPDDISALMRKSALDHGFDGSVVLSGVGAFAFAAAAAMAFVWLARAGHEAGRSRPAVDPATVPGRP